MSPRRPHGSLSLDDIVDAGLALAAEVGFEKINIRALATRLDCSPMAIYGHVKDKEGLLAEMADRAIGTMKLPDHEQDWIEWYVGVALASWSTMCRYPGLDAYVLTRGPVLMTPSSIGVTNRMFEVLLRAGFSPGETATLWRTTHTYLSGHAMLARRPSSVLPANDSTLPPATSDVYKALSAPMDEDWLEAGLRHILRGFGSHER